MARGRARPERRPGRQQRPFVPALDDIPPSDDPDGPAGTAGVREPRRPKPSGPLSDAGERPVPEPFLVACLPDPRS